MKKIGILILCLFFLQACKESGTEINKIENNAVDKGSETAPSELVTTPSKQLPLLELDRASFHSVIGWMSNDEILFVLMENGEWTVQSYTLSNGTWETIYKTKTPIIQGIIHPTKEMILLHTSSNSTSAEIQILEKNGSIAQSLLFESAEIYMDWHPTNPNLIVFSTFFEDWTYNSFVYNVESDILKPIDVENPFVKWYDEDQLMVFKWSETSLDGSELLLHSISDGKLESTGLQYVLDVHNLGDSMLYVFINETQKQFEYRLVQKETETTFEWTSPAVSNYSEWVAPTVSIISPNELLAIQSTETGNVDEIQSKSILSKFSFDGEKQFGHIIDQPIDCSPNGKVCLGGYEKENWIQLDPFKEQTWLHIKE